MKKVFILAFSFFIIFFITGCTRYFDSTIPCTYVYFDSYQELYEHISSGYMRPLRPELSEEEYEELVVKGELKNYGLHYRNYVSADIARFDPKINYECYLLFNKNGNDASPYDINGNQDLIYLYQIKSGEGLYLIALETKPWSKTMVQELDTIEWKKLNRESLNYYDSYHKYKIATNFKKG